MAAVAQTLSLFAGVRHVPPPRRRGGQPGNRNRLRHGGFSKAARARRAAVRALIRKMDRLIVLARALHAADARTRHIYAMTEAARRRVRSSAVSSSASRNTASV